MVLRVVMGIIYSFIAYKLGNFRNWRNYYSTIEFWIIGNLISLFLTYNYPLWELTSPGEKITFNELIFCVFVFPFAGLIYLANYPQKAICLQRICYIIFWISYFSVFELILGFFGYLKYSHGWDIVWSVIFNSCMFPLMRIHYKHPPWAWGLATVIGVSIIIYFRIPVSAMK
ncbi:CBO0543 family protein [Desulfosporosinus sp. FKB]|uniref:CBO0543 family protein n=1 Tax=Desulfosporosinus sp. FKB TaxID=1969835 RepID=UPI000B4A4563|nr:CBO0543 family protein [Desulfosporosinus sp. FKB]